MGNGWRDLSALPWWQYGGLRNIASTKHFYVNNSTGNKAWSGTQFPSFSPCCCCCCCCDPQLSHFVSGANHNFAMQGYRGHTQASAYVLVLVFSLNSRTFECMPAHTHTPTHRLLTSTIFCNMHRTLHISLAYIRITFFSLFRNMPRCQRQSCIKPINECPW